MKRKLIPTREAWLDALVEAFRPHFKTLGHPLPEKIRVSCGWPQGSRGSRKRTGGEAWSPAASSDGRHETFISPELFEADFVAHVLAHEVVHHAVGIPAGHRAPFSQLARSIGLKAPWTATTPTDQFWAWARPLVDALGPYPHSKLSAGESGRKKQKTRLIKCECPGCGYVIRTTALWLGDKGAPICPDCNVQFAVDLPGGAGACLPPEEEEDRG